MFSGLLLTALPLTGEGYGGWVSFFCKKEQKGTKRNDGYSLFFCNFATK